MRDIPKNYRSITYAEFLKEKKINDSNFQQLMEICNKYDAILEEKKKLIWFGGLREGTKNFFKELNRLVGINE